MDPLLMASVTIEEVATQVAGALAELNVDFDSPLDLVAALALSIHAVARAQGARTRAEATRVEANIARTRAEANIARLQAVFEETSALLETLQGTISKIGASASSNLLSLYPLGAARGNSAGELAQMIDRYEHGLDTRLILTTRPSNPKFPLDVASVSPAGPVSVTVALGA